MAFDTEQAAVIRKLSCSGGHGSFKSIQNDPRNGYMNISPRISYEGRLSTNIVGNSTLHNSRNANQKDQITLYERDLDK